MNSRWIDVGPHWFTEETCSTWKDYVGGLMEEAFFTPDMEFLSKTTKHLLFVYGTLRKGGSRHGLLADCPIYARGWTEGNHYQMVDCGAYPAVVDVGEADGMVYGEVYQVSPSKLQTIDRVEANGYLFDRQTTNVIDHRGEVHKCFWYPLLPNTPRDGDEKPLSVIYRRKDQQRYYAYDVRSSKNV